MSTDDERRADEGPEDAGTSAADEYRDPTAPPPVQDETPSDRTQPIGTETQPFAVPSPQYDQPTYSQPSYSLPSYGSPSSGDAPTGEDTGSSDVPPPPPAPGTAAPYGATPAPYGSAPSPSGDAPSPYGASPAPYGASPAPYTASGSYPPPSNPYAAPTPPPGSYPYAAPPTPYQSAPSNTSAIVLTVLSGLALVSCCNVVAIASLVLGIMGISRNGTDPVDARRLTRIGWWVFGVSVALAVIGIVVFFSLGLSGAFDDGSSGSYDPDGSFDGY